jgi:outer membrane lipoprotein carrier protein
MMNGQQQRISLAIVSLVLAWPAIGQEADEGQRLIEDFLSGVMTISGRFEQQLIDADDNVVEESAGTLDIARPGRFRWSYAEPYEQELIADGVNIWSYDVDLEQVTVKPQAEALGSTPALLLGGSTEVLEDFNYLGSFADRGTTWVLLKPKDTDSGFNKVELGFTDGDLTRMLFGDNLEQTTLIALVDVIYNEPIDPGRFEFTPPDGVDVVGEPLARSAADL